MNISCVISGLHSEFFTKLQLPEIFRERPSFRSANVTVQLYKQPAGGAVSQVIGLIVPESLT